MTETPSTEDQPAFPGRRAAFWLGAGLLGALFIVLAVTTWDNGRRSTLETTAEFTAVGDTHYFPMPRTPPSLPSQAVASLHGEPLYPADLRPHECALDDMARAGVDDRTGCVIYQAPQVKKDLDDRQFGDIYYLKISPTEFLKTRTSHP